MKFWCLFHTRLVCMALGQFGPIDKSRDGLIVSKLAFRHTIGF